LPTAPAGLTYPALARFRDITLALVALVIASPILLVLAGLARLSTGASGVFSHRRLGRKGRSFLLYKLRTLHPQAPPQVNKGEGESAATPLGRLLRTSKLDELPQLWNVVKGEMSLVGPRPIIPQEYSEKSHYQRLAVKPGLTGLWQLSNHRGNPFDENPEYDLFYLANRSFGFDLWILWRTILLVVLGKETEISLAARLWEKDPSWRQAAPDEFNDIPGEVRVWHLRMAAFVAFAVACLSLAVGAGLIGRGWSHALAEVLARRLAGVGSVQVSGLVAEQAEVLNPMQIWLAVGLAVLFSMLFLPAAKWAGERRKLLSRAGVFASSRKLISYLGGPGLALAAVGAFAASAGIPRGFGGLLIAGVVLSLLGLLADRRRQLDQRGAIDSILKYCVVAIAILIGAVGSNRGFLGAIGIMVLCAIVMSALERLDRLGGAGASSAAAIGFGVFFIALMTGQ